MMKSLSLSLSLLALAAAVASAHVQAAPEWQQIASLGYGVPRVHAPAHAPEPPVTAFHRLLAPRAPVAGAARARDAENPLLPYFRAALWRCAPTAGTATPCPEVRP
jgi:hypothetical protein